MSRGGTGLLDQRGTLFAYTVAMGTNNVPVERYPEWGTRWCRLEPPSGQERTAAQREAHRWDAIIAFRGDIPIERDWLVRVAGLVYRVVAVLPRRMQGLTHVYAASADDTADTLVES